VISIEKKVKKTMNDFSMVNYGDKIAVAVSGGKDSLSLLYILKKILKGITSDLIAITVDEGINGYRDESIQIVRQFCTRMNIENKIVSYKELFELSTDDAVVLRNSNKISSCSICGTMRRRALDLLAERSEANVIATGHNLDDYIQSFFINLFSGDIDRISWNYPKPVEYGAQCIRKIKPMMGLYEKEIIFYALHKDFPFQTLECPYMHESIRSDIRVFLNQLEESHPGIKYNIYNSVLKVSKGLKIDLTSKQSLKCLICKRESSNKICSVCRTVQMLSHTSGI